MIEDKLVLVDNEYARTFLTPPFNKVGIRVVLEWNSYLDPDSPDYILNKKIAVLIVGDSIYKRIHQLDVERKIHLGLRNYNWGTMKNTSIITYRECKMVFPDPGNLSAPYNMPKYKEFLRIDLNAKSEFILENKEIVLLDDIDKVLNKFNTKTDMGFDFESNGFPEEWYFQPVGIGIARRDYGGYIDFRYYSSEASRDKGLKMFRDWVHEYYRYLWGYYISFEVNALRRMFGEFFPINDMMALLKCDEYSAGLKVSAQNYLHIGAWDTEQDDLMDKVNRMFFIGRSYDNVVRLLNNEFNESDPDYSVSKEMKEIFKYFEPYKFDMKMIEKYWGGPFAVTPTEITGKYCIYDAYYTLCEKDVVDGKYHYIKTRY